MCFGRERPGPQLIPADVGSVGKDRERRRPRAGRRIERRFELDRPYAIGCPNREVRNPHALAGPRPFDRSITGSKACRVGADQRSGGYAAGFQGRRQVQPFRTVEAVSKGAKSRHGQHAVGDGCFVPPPFSIHVVERRVRVCENHVRMPIWSDALDHEDRERRQFVIMSLASSAIWQMWNVATMNALHFILS
jgi:hypothetical protein